MQRRMPGLIFIGARMPTSSRRAPCGGGDPAAELVVLEEADHYAAHMSPDDVVLGGVLRALHASD